ncbi:MAG TPA: tail fiber protein [Candidatus Limnocylindria bacterium]|jgi:microcystin-dependent protein|nr:tail fiber protein [Candidatus Limnocylindria bacterium]
MSQPYLGTIMMFGGNFAINGWAMCNGQQLAISSNTALFSILGTSFGGNGTQTFGLPDFRGRVPIHQGQGLGLSTYVLGENGGTENTTLLYNQMPSHTHLVNASSVAGNAVTTTNTVLASENTGQKPELYSTNAPNTTMNPLMIQNAGGNQPFSIMQPYLCVTFLVALVGVFPSRN